MYNVYRRCKSALSEQASSLDKSKSARQDHSWGRKDQKVSQKQGERDANESDKRREPPRHTEVRWRALYIEFSDEGEVAND